MHIIYTSIEGEVFVMTFIGKVSESSDVDIIKSDISIVSKEIKKFYNSQDKKIKILIDATQFKADYIIEGASALIELAKEDKDLVEKTAIFSEDRKLKIFAETIITLSGRKNIMFFDDKSSAVDWLNQ